MFNMNTMMNLGSMAGMGGFGGFGNFTGINGYSTGYNPFVGSVFSFYGSGCCDGANYSTKTCGDTNGWEPLGAILGYTALMTGVPLLTKGTGKLINHIKSNTNSAKQADAEGYLKDTESKLETEYAKLGVSDYVAAKNYTINSDPTYTKWNNLNSELSKMQSTDLSDMTRAYNDAKYAYEADSTNQTLKKAFEDAQRNLNTLNASIKSKKEEVEKAKKAMDAREIEIAEIKARIVPLEAQRKKEQEAVDKLKLDELDGRRSGRTTANDFKQIYDLDDNAPRFGKKKNGATYTAGDIKKADMKYLLSEYATLADGDKKDKIRNFILDNWNGFDQKIREQFKPVLEIMQRDKKKI